VRFLAYDMSLTTDVIPSLSCGKHASLAKETSEPVDRFVVGLHPKITSSADARKVVACTIEHEALLFPLSSAATGRAAPQGHVCEHESET